MKEKRGGRLGTPFHVNGTLFFVANDGTPAYLYHNEHDGNFKEIGMMSGMAMSAEGNAMAAMCMSLGDYDHDGFEDVYISDF